MDTTLLREIQRIQRLSVNELKIEWSRLYDGEPCRSRNRSYVVKRLCWRLQEIRICGLSDHARARVAELAPDNFNRARTPREALDATVETNRATSVRTPGTARDPRLPSPGTTIAKQYKGRELRVVVRDDGLELDGEMYASATALAKAVTGSRSINGWLFLGVRKRSRK